MFQHMTSAKMSLGRVFVEASDTESDERNASALDTLCAWGRPVGVGGGSSPVDASVLAPIAFGMDRVFRSLRTGGERLPSVGRAGGMLDGPPFLKTAEGRNE